MILVTFITRLTTRRWWGGWMQPKHWVKIAVVFTLTSLISLGCGFDLFSLLNGLVLTLAFLNTFHGEGMNMGRSPSLTFWQCIGVMGGSYSFYTTLLGLSLSYCTSNWLYMLVSPVGFLVAFSYAFGWYIFKPWMVIEWPKGQMFIDGAGSLGELMLGALLFSCVPFARYFLGV